jgi:hypothetical protein
VVHRDRGLELADRLCPHQVQHLLGQVQLVAHRPVLAPRAHALTPTRTLVNRAGAAGWPVCPTCPGWPLPQFGVPHGTICDDSMSIDRQNSGPIPV